MSKVSAWTDEIYAEMKQAYLARMEELPVEDRAKHSSEVVNEIATDKGFSLNAFRMKLSRDGVYIKKEPATKAAASGEAKTGGTRTSKADAQSELIAALTDGGIATADIDMAIVEKLTGKAAVHLAALIRQVTK